MSRLAASRPSRRKFFALSGLPALVAPDLPLPSEQPDFDLARLLDSVLSTSAETDRRVAEYARLDAAHPDLHGEGGTYEGDLLIRRFEQEVFDPTDCRESDARDALVEAVRRRGCVAAVVRGHLVVDVRALAESEHDETVAVLPWRAEHGFCPAVAPASCWSTLPARLAEASR